MGSHDPEGTPTETAQKTTPAVRIEAYDHHGHRTRTYTLRAPPGGFVAIQAISDDFKEAAGGA